VKTWNTSRACCWHASVRSWKWMEWLVNHAYNTWKLPSWSELTARLAILYIHLHKRPLSALLSLSLSSSLILIRLYNFRPVGLFLMKHKSLPLFYFADSQHQHSGFWSKWKREGKKPSFSFWSLDHINSLR
jgi:hypothetical protein